MVHIYNGILLSHKKGEILPFVIAWIDLEGIVISVVKSKRERQIHIISCICESIKQANKKKRTNITKQKQTHRHREQTDSCQRGGGGGRVEIY